MTDRELRLRRRIDDVTGERNSAIARAEEAERKLTQLRSVTGRVPGTHCIYCGERCYWSVCSSHLDVARIDGRLVA